MSIAIERSVLRDFERSSRLEWLETNGLGGWAMSTVSGAHSRRYHGLLVAATRPPVERMVLLSRLDETVRAGGRSIELGASRFPGAVHPRGFERLRALRARSLSCLRVRPHGRGRGRRAAQDGRRDRGREHGRRALRGWRRRTPGRTESSSSCVRSTPSAAITSWERRPDRFGARRRSPMTSFATEHGTARPRSTFACRAPGSSRRPTGGCASSSRRRSTAASTVTRTCSRPACCG